MNRMLCCALLTLLLPVAAAAQQAATAGAAAVPVGAHDAAATITPEDYIGRIGIMAHDSMRGRDTPSPELDETAAWIASEFERMGLAGGAEDGGFVQRYPLRAVVVDRERSQLTGDGVRLAFGADLLPLVGETVAGEATGALVLVSGSSGAAAALTGVRGKHAVLVLAADAPGLDNRLFQLVLAIRDAGAASVMVTNPTGEARWRTNVERVLQPVVEKGWAPRADAGAPFRPLLQIRTSSLARLLEGSGIDVPALQQRSAADIRLDDVPGVTLTLTQEIRRDDLAAPNVVGVLEGSDPRLADEYVVFSAHMDHVGVGAPDANGDSIFNGADDDASGTSAVVEIAEAMASLPTPPARSMIFLLVSGEEKGLWGSEYYAAHPSAPVENLVANLNIDMIGRNWTDTVVAIGKEHSDLGQSLERISARHAELDMSAIDDLWPQENFYFRSDHYNFARAGVPILFFFSGTHDDYHGVDDESERIDAEKATRIAKLIFYLGLDIADAPERPRWDPESYRRIVTDGGR